MESVLRQTLQGRVVTKATVVHDYVQLAFGDRIGVSIFNEMQIAPQSTPVHALVGKVVASINESESSIEVRFLDDSRIVIDMRQVEYRGPEALALFREGLPTVAWN